MSMTSGEPVRVLLGESDIPRQWYNIVADLPKPPPRPLHPRTHRPLEYADMADLCVRDLTLQDASAERFIDIPDEVVQAYKLWRPSPLYRARNLERALGTPARIYYKYEGGSPTGSHKVNTAVPQAFYNARQGVERLTTETGAGQWGSALAFACAQFEVACEVWWAGASFDTKPYRKVMMEAYGAIVHRSPSELTEAGRKALAEAPDNPGSIGLAVSEAVEVAFTDPKTFYALGSAASHVLLHQTVIGEEALRQFELAGDFPDVLVGCVGGGSGLAGLAFPFLREKLAGRREGLRVLAVEPTACPAFTRGRYAWDYGDRQGLTPLMKMHTVGHAFTPDPIHAGGLRYHGMAPLLSHVYDLGLIEAVARPQSDCFTAGCTFARAEGIVAAPEATHALAGCIAEALRCKETGEEQAILALVTGHAHFDLPAYETYLSGQLVDHDLPEDRLRESLDQLPVLASQAAR